MCGGFGNALPGYHGAPWRSRLEKDEAKGRTVCSILPFQEVLLGVCCARRDLGKLKAATILPPPWLWRCRATCFLNSGHNKSRPSFICSANIYKGMLTQRARCLMLSSNKLHQLHALKWCVFLSSLLVWIRKPRGLTQVLCLTDSHKTIDTAPAQSLRSYQRLVRERDLLSNLAREGPGLKTSLDMARGHFPVSCHMSFPTMKTCHIKVCKSEIQ